MKRLMIVGALSLMLSGCYTLRSEISRGYDDEFQDKVYMSQVRGGKLQQRFEETEGVAFTFWGLGVAKQSDPASVLSKYLEKGNKISNLRITTERSFVDSLVGGLTLGLYNPWTVRYEGEIIKAKK